MTMENEQSHIATRSPRDRGFTLFEILVVVGLILFLSRLTFFHFTGGPQAHQLEAAIKNVGSYFNSASQTASSSRQWVIVVVNVDSDTEGSYGNWAPINGSMVQSPLMMKTVMGSMATARIFWISMVMNLTIIMWLVG